MLCRKCYYQQDPRGIFQALPGFLVPAVQEAFNHLNALLS
jgi:hypothetical protein